ncbi:MAG: putative ribosylglycoyhydrolase [Frankiales bacterium]|nr:putative ribosylglycoyhydrolase [Frankiales bacterium]
MGAQVAALLAGPPPYGDVPPPGPVTGSLRLDRPAGFTLDATARSGGGVALPPSSYDGERLARRVPGGVVRVDSALTVTWEGDVADPGDLVRRVLGLDDDVTELHDGCRRVPSLAWVPEAGAGRVLRAPTVWEDLVGLLLATRTSFRSARAAVARLVGDGPFPTPDDVARRPELPGGYRAAHLRALARAVADGEVDPELWRELPDDEVQARVRALPGLGPFSAASLLPLLGRPRPLVLDGWLAAQAVPGWEKRLAPLGRWSGTGLWLEVSGAWLCPRGAGAAGGADGRAGSSSR